MMETLSLEDIHYNIRLCANLGEPQESGRFALVLFQDVTPDSLSSLLSHPTGTFFAFEIDFRGSQHLLSAYYYQAGTKNTLGSSLVNPNGAPVNNGQADAILMSWYPPDEAGGMVTLSRNLSFHYNGIQRFAQEVHLDDSIFSGSSPVSWGIIAEGYGAFGAHQGVCTYTNDCLGSLPVEFIDFSGKSKPEGVALNWTVTNESRMESHLVQSSIDGISFETIGTVKAINDEYHKYNFVDEEPVTGTNYYRISSIGKDGNIETSKIVSINVSKNDHGLPKLFPNPVNGGFINLQSPKNGLAYLRDLSGKLLSSFEVLEGENIWPIQDIPSGLYLATIQFGNSTYLQKILIL